MAAEARLRAERSNWRKERPPLFVAKPKAKADPIFCPSCGWKFDADPGMKDEWIGCSGCGEVFQMDPNAGA